MPLSTGMRLGPHEILALIGAGGMGEVYRARDSKLGRDVALKFLPAPLAGDAEYMARFQREAHVLASLNHPHIASIYGLEESGSVRALVMELVEGPTLADRIQAGPVPLEEALELAKQIAEALEYAHEKGVIHRDLKPANVKLTPEGTVKVLDFGLAKAAERTAKSGHWENSPTLPMSQPGLILGTPEYMAPEQARGEAVDKRADIWAFGVVLLEMLTGKRTFSGETTSDTLAAVLTKDPDWEQLQAAIPASIRKLLLRCLERDRRKRLQAIGDARLEIEDYLANPVPVVPAARHRVLPWLVAAVFACVAVIISLLYFHQSSPESPLVQFTIPPPETGGYMHLAASPDGRMLAFADYDNNSPADRIVLRRLDSLTSQTLASGDDALLPFWSPDSRFLGFWAYYQRKLKIIDVEAPAGPGRLRTLCSSPGPGGATWNRDGIIVFSGGKGQPLYRTTASSGEAAALTKLDPSRQEKTHFWPWFLPDGRHFLYTVVSDKQENSGIYVGTLDSPERKRLLGDLSNAVYVTAPVQGGLLVFVRGDTLMAQRFDAARLRLSAEPVPVAEQVLYGADFAEGFYTVSENGVLAYLRGVQTQLVWFDRSGKQIGTMGEPGIHEGGFSLSPDDKRVAVARRDSNTGTSDIWLIEAVNGFISRFTSDPSEDFAPVWSPDGKQLVFSSNRGGVFDLYQKDADGGGREELLLKSGVTKWARDWSRDGRFLLYNEKKDGATQDFFWMLPLFGDRKPALFQRTEHHEHFGAFSPDGKWVAFESGDSGQSEIYVTAVPGMETAASPKPAKWQISHGGGKCPQWRRDGRELYYLAHKNRFMAVGVSASPTSQPGVPRVLFEAPSFRNDSTHASYAVTADGQRFLLLSKVETSTPALTVVLNWTKGLKP